MLHIVCIRLVVTSQLFIIQIILIFLQDFEWMMSRDAEGERIKIISTFDGSYSHPSLSKRVASGDISVVRLQDNEVELKIAEVKPQDAGFYWCQTPSTDSNFSGNKEAQVQLTGKGQVCVCVCVFMMQIYFQSLAVFLKKSKQTNKKTLSGQAVCTCTGVQSTVLHLSAIPMLY